SGDITEKAPVLALLALRNRAYAVPGNLCQQLATVGQSSAAAPCQPVARHVMSRADHHRDEAVAGHRSEGTRLTMSPQHRTDTLAVIAIMFAQTLARRACLHPATIVQDETRPIRIGHNPVDITGDEQLHAGFGLQCIYQPGFQQRCIFTDALEIKRSDDPLAVAEMVIKAANARARSVADHFYGGGIHAVLGEAGKRGLEDFLFA